MRAEAARYRRLAAIRTEGGTAADRQLVELGRLEITGISPTGAADERRMVFDPTNLTDGIDLSADPILLVRSAAYSISYDHCSEGG